MSDTRDTAALIARVLAEAYSYDDGLVLELVRQEIRADKVAAMTHQSVSTLPQALAQALVWESYTCRCGEPVQHYLPSKYCPGSDVEGPLWAEYLAVAHDHVHWATVTPPS